MTKSKPQPKPQSPKRVKSPIADLVVALKDKEYRQAWIANLAMAYIDNERWYREKMKANIGKLYLSRIDKHRIANNAAEYFLNLLVREVTQRRKAK